MNYELFGCLRSLGAVLGTSLLAVRNASGIKSSTDNVVSRAGQILDSSASDQNDRVFLKIVALARNVGCNFDSVRKTYAVQTPRF